MAESVERLQRRVEELERELAQERSRRAVGGGDGGGGRVRIEKMSPEVVDSNPYRYLHYGWEAGEGVRSSSASGQEQGALPPFPAYTAFHLLLLALGPAPKRARPSLSSGGKVVFLLKHTHPLPKQPYGAALGPATDTRAIFLMPLFVYLILHKADSN